MPLQSSPEKDISSVKEIICQKVGEFGFIFTLAWKIKKFHFPPVSDNRGMSVQEKSQDQIELTAIISKVFVTHLCNKIIFLKFFLFVIMVHHRKVEIIIFKIFLKVGKMERNFCWKLYQEFTSAVILKSQLRREGEVREVRFQLLRSEAVFEF